MKRVKLLLVGLILSVTSFAGIASCITCSTAANNGKCDADGSCAKGNETGSSCCGTYIPPPAP